MSAKGEPLAKGWTVAEERLLCRLYPSKGLQACVAAIPGRSPAALQHRAAQLGLRIDAKVRSITMANAQAHRRATRRAALVTGWPGPQPVDAVLTAWSQRRERSA